MEETIVQKVADTLVRAGSTFSQDKVEAYTGAMKQENDPKAQWVMRLVLQDASSAAKNRGPLCDDTGIPHLLLEVGPKRAVTGELLEVIEQGVAQGLRMLPGRPMGIMGDDGQRLDQSGGLSDDPAWVAPAPVLIRRTQEDVLRLHILMQGGGPAIRGQTLRVFHKHSVQAVLDEIVQRAEKAVKELGCSPCTLAIGIGRSQMEATALMTQAQIDGSYANPSAFEQEITRRVNEACNGPMNLGGRTAVLGTFLKVGPQRASGVRIVCIRPCCCFEPRHASVDLV